MTKRQKVLKRINQLYREHFTGFTILGINIRPSWKDRQDQGWIRAVGLRAKYWEDAFDEEKGKLEKAKEEVAYWHQQSDVQEKRCNGFIDENLRLGRLRIERMARQA